VKTGKQPVVRTLRLVAFLLCVGTALSAHASSVLPLDLGQLVDRSEQVVHVRCLGNQVVADANVGVATVTTFAVFERAKGASGPTLTVRQAGGEMNGIAVKFPVPAFVAGEEYVLFMPRFSRLGLASPVGLSQGVFHVAVHAGTKEVGNGRDFADLLVGVDPASLPTHAAARLKSAPADRTRLELADFMTVVRARTGMR